VDRRDRWTRHFIEAVDDGWQLWTRKPGVAFYWFSKSIDELEAIVAKTDANWVEHDAAMATPSASIITELAGLKATAHYDRGQFNVRLWSTEENRVVGTYFGGLNNPVATFVLDELTIQGTRHLDENLRGRGIGAGLIDLAEKVCGLRAVPHGFMGTDGKTSGDAWKSWQSRKLRQPVPGMERKANVEARAALLPEMAARRALKFNTDDYDRGLVLANEFGLGLTTVSFCAKQAGFFTTSNDVSYAFPTRADGSVVSGAGIDELNSAISNNLILDVSENRLEDAEVSFIEAESVALKIEKRNSTDFYRPLEIDPKLVELVREREANRPGMALAVGGGYGL
jgi:transposase